MKVKSVTVVFEDDDGPNITAFFSGGKWALSAPVYSRFHAALHDVWKILRDACHANKAGQDLERSRQK